MNNEVESVWKRSWPNLRQYPFCVAEVWETTVNLSQDRRSLHRDLTQGPPESEAGV
jgi:hypothetical protein